MSKKKIIIPNGKEKAIIKKDSKGRNNYWLYYSLPKDEYLRNIHFTYGFDEKGEMYNPHLSVMVKEMDGSYKINIYESGSIRKWKL